MTEELAGSGALGAKALVLRWVNAFNARDLEALLSCLTADVDFCPLKLVGLRGAYRGHDGVRSWFAQVNDFPYRHCIDLAEVRDISDGRLLGIGALCVTGHGPVVPFCASHTFRDGLIAATHHYAGDPDRMSMLSWFLGRGPLDPQSGGTGAPRGLDWNSDCTRGPLSDRSQSSGQDKSAESAG